MVKSDDELTYDNLSLTGNNNIDYTTILSDRMCGRGFDRDRDCMGVSKNVCPQFGDCTIICVDLYKRHILYPLRNTVPKQQLLS